jgi:hypothetical protein
VDDDPFRNQLAKDAEHSMQSSGTNSANAHEQAEIPVEMTNDAMDVINKPSSRVSPRCIVLWQSRAFGGNVRVERPRLVLAWCTYPYA